MKINRNENLLDRLIRILLAEIFFIMGYFWVGGVLEIVLIIIGIVSLFTAITGFCALYKIFNINTLIKFPKPLTRIVVSIFVLVMIVLPILGIYYSNFFTRKIFLEDYNRMNNYYKQTLFNTGKNLREESIVNYENLVIEYDKFQNKYNKYHPLVIKEDKQFNKDINNVSVLIKDSRHQIYNGDLEALHIKLEQVRMVFQDMLKRNNFSMLAVYLVDFHDSMEKVIEAADNKNKEGVISSYVEANEKMLSVEEVSNDEEIKTIRKNLDDILKLAEDGKDDEMSAKAAELKSSFVKVYLKRG